jgi:epidermal growth factor receptor substrate 15
MHLIQSKLAGKDIPATLPTSLIPPSMRSAISQQQQQQPLAPVNELSDLLFDDAPLEPAKLVQPALQPQSTGAFSSTPLHSSTPLQPQQTAGSSFGSPPVQQQTTGSFQSTILQPQSTGTYGTKSPPLHPQTTGSFGGQPSAFSSPFSAPQPTLQDPFGAPAGMQNFEQFVTQLT